MTQLQLQLQNPFDALDVLVSREQVRFEWTPEQSVLLVWGLPRAP